jgi:hypothetical protein
MQAPVESCKRSAIRPHDGFDRSRARQECFAGMEMGSMPR